MVLRLISCSPRRRIRLVTVIRGIRFCLRPVGPTSLHEFNTSNGCQNHTALPSAQTSFVSRAANRSRGLSRPALVTTRDRPSVGRDGKRYRFDSSQADTEIFLQTGLDRRSGKTPTDL